MHELDATNFIPDWFGINTFENNGQAYTVYADNAALSFAENTTTTQPDPITVVSDPNGQAVVVQVGNEYQWNSTLDGLPYGWCMKMMMTVGLEQQFICAGGMQQGSIGLTDQVGSNLVVNHPYVIDENGMIKVTEDTAFQYYQVTAVENGVIITADDSSFPLSDTNRFFTNRAAAEEYYSSKVSATVISDPNGKAVVTQLGNEYHGIAR